MIGVYALIKDKTAKAIIGRSIRRLVLRERYLHLGGSDMLKIPIP